MDKDSTAVSAPLERRVRPLRKADLARLALLLDDWRRQEANLASYDLAVVPGSMRAKRIKDAAALQAALAFILACRDLGKRPNVPLERRRKASAPSGVRRLVEKREEL